jgi:hypothetical protein
MIHVDDAGADRVEDLEGANETAVGVDGHLEPTVR